MTAQTPRYRRILLKLSGEALAGGGADALDAAVLRLVAQEVKGVAAEGVQVASVVGGGNPVRGGGPRRRLGPPRGPRRPPRPHRGGDAAGGRALHPPPGHPPPGERAGGHLRRRHRQPVLHHGHGGGVARHRGGGGRPAHGQAWRLRCLRQGPAPPPRRGDVPSPRLHGTAQPQPEGDGRDRRRLVQGQQPGYRRLRYHPTGQPEARRAGGADRHARGRAPMSGRGGGGRKAPGQKPGHGGAVDAITLDVINDAKSRMQKALEATRHEFASIRTGRANPALLEQIKVDYYGALTPVNQLATITVPEPRLLVVAPWDKKMVKDVERAILKSELGLVPSSDGTVIRIPIPTLTEERRRDLVKVVRKHAEEGRVAVRNIRREAKEMIEELEESGDVSEDAAQRAMEELQKLTDELIAAVDKALEAKEKEILEL